LYKVNFISQNKVDSSIKNLISLNKVDCSIKIAIEKFSRKGQITTMVGHPIIKVPSLGAMYV
jgi:hypothetical protein